MIDQDTISIEDKQFTSVDLAYPLAIASYDTMIKRIDALDGRIQSLMAFALGLCLAVPTFARAQTLPLASPWFVSATIAMLLAITVSVYARYTGAVKVITPANLWEGWLHLTPFEFKKDAVYNAAEAYKANKALLDRKWRLSIVGMATFGLSLVFLIVWVAIAGRQT